MARTVNLYEAKTHLSALVKVAASGEEIIIAKNASQKTVLRRFRSRPANAGHPA